MVSYNILFLGVVLACLVGFAACIMVLVLWKNVANAVQPRELKEVAAKLSDAMMERVKAEFAPAFAQELQAHLQQYYARKRDYALKSDIPAIPAVPVAPDLSKLVTKDELEEKLRTFRTTGASGASSGSAALPQELVEYLAAAHALNIGRLRAPLDEEVAKLETEIATAKKPIEALTEKVRKAREKVSDKKRALLPETADKKAVLREAEKLFPEADYDTLGLDVRFNKMAEYASNRATIVQERKDALEDAERELDEAETALTAKKAQANTSAAEQKLAKLRDQLSAFIKTERLIAELQKMVSAPARSLPRATPRPSVPPPPKPTAASPTTPKPNGGAAPLPAPAPKPVEKRVKVDLKARLAGGPTVKGNPPAPAPAPAPPAASPVPEPPRPSDPPEDVDDEAELLDPGRSSVTEGLNQLISSASSALPPAPTPRFCIKCGTPFMAGQGFCGHCGAKAEAPPSS